MRDTKKTAGELLCMTQQGSAPVETAKSTGAGFTNDFRETLTYGEPLKHEFYLILRTFEYEKVIPITS